MCSGQRKPQNRSILFLLQFCFWNHFCCCCCPFWSFFVLFVNKTLHFRWANKSQMHIKCIIIIMYNIAIPNRVIFKWWHISFLFSPNTFYLQYLFVLSQSYTVHYFCVFTFYSISLYTQTILYAIRYWKEKLFKHFMNAC